MATTPIHTLPAQRQSTHYPILDIIRLLCALLVVVIHCLEVPTGHPIARAITTCFSYQAVPYFFIVSGFFFGKKLYKSNQQTKEILKSVKGYLLLYFAWIALDLPRLIVFYSNANAGKSIGYIAAVIFRRIFFAGQGVYWYLLVLAESILVCGLLIKCKKEILLYIYAPIGLILGYLYDAGIQQGVLGQFNHLIYLVFSWNNNVLMDGLPFVTIGLFLSRRENLEKLNRTALIAAYSAFSLITVIFFAILYPENINATKYFFNAPIQAVLLFLIAVQPSNVTIKKEITNHCRDLSATIYLVHATFIYQLIDKLWSVDSPILAKFLLATALSAGVYCIAKFLKFKPLSWLLSIKN